MKKILSFLMGKGLVVFLTLVLYSGVVIAADCPQSGGIDKHMCEFCTDVKANVPIIALLMFLTAGLIYGLIYYWWVKEV